MHGVKCEGEVWLVQQSLECIKVKDGAQQLQVVLHRVYHLQAHNASQIATTFGH